MDPSIGIITNTFSDLSPEIQLNSIFREAALKYSTQQQMENHLEK